MRLKPVSPGEAVVGLVFFLFMGVCTLLAMLVFIPSMIINRKYAKGLLHAMDHVMNAFIGRSPDHTVSSECGKRIKAGTAGWFCKGLCAILSKIEPGHCVGAIEDNNG